MAAVLELLETMRVGEAKEGILEGCVWLSFSPFLIFLRISFVLLFRYPPPFFTSSLAPFKKYLAWCRRSRTGVSETVHNRQHYQLGLRGKKSFIYCGVQHYLSSNESLFSLSAWLIMLEILNCLPSTHVAGAQQLLKHTSVRVTAQDS